MVFLHPCSCTNRVPDTIGVPHIHVGRTPHFSVRQLGEALQQAWIARYVDAFGGAEPT